MVHFLLHSFSSNANTSCPQDEQSSDQFVMDKDSLRVNNFMRITFLPDHSYMILHTKAEAPDHLNFSKKQLTEIVGNIRSQLISGIIEEAGLYKEDCEAETLTKVTKHSDIELFIRFTTDEIRIEIKSDNETEVIHQPLEGVLV